MKRLVVLAALILAVASACAFGAVKEFGEFTLDIPNGWTAERDEDVDPSCYSLAIDKEDGSSSVNVTYAPTHGSSIEELLEDWTNMEDSASDPERTSDGYYMYTYQNEAGKKATCYVRSEAGGKMYVSIEFIGNDTDTMTAIRDSFALKNAAPKAAAPKAAENKEPDDDEADDDEADDDEKPDDEADDEDADDDDADDDDADANVDAQKDANGNTRLIWSAFQGNTSEVRYLLKAGADVHMKNKWGMSALMYAAEGNHTSIIRALLKAGADINAKNNEGSTSLMIAAIHGCEEAASVLLDAGADVKTKNNDGKTALDYARANKDLKGSDFIKRLKKLAKD